MSHWIDDGPKGEDGLQQLFDRLLQVKRKRIRRRAVRQADSDESDVVSGFREKKEGMVTTAFHRGYAPHPAPG
jgi:hypothetical protein